LEIYKSRGGKDGSRSNVAVIGVPEVENSKKDRKSVVKEGLVEWLKM
jgi:hypothetical protein